VKPAALAAMAVVWLSSPAPMARGELPELAARMSAQEGASEYWDLAARFDTGHALVARFLITNQGPGKHTAIALGHLIFPDGRTASFTNGRARDKWKLKDDGLYLDVGSSELGLRGPERSYEVDKDRDGVKIFLKIQASAAPSPAPEGPPGYHVSVLDVAAPIEGTIWIRDRKMPEPLAVRGRVALTHTWVDRKESALALRRIDFASLGAEGAFVLLDMRASKGPGLRWIAVEREGRIAYQTADFQISQQPSADSSRGDDYPVPSGLRFHNDRLDGSFALERILLRRNPLEELPLPLRFLLSLDTRPRRVWAESPFELKFQGGSDRSTWQLRGTGIASLTYLNPAKF